MKTHGGMDAQILDFGIVRREKTKKLHNLITLL
jgi:hypothetical protein